MNNSYKIPENITFESIDNKIYILNIENGEYFKLSDSASLIWSEIEKGTSSKDIKTNIELGFDETDEIGKDIDETLKNFIQLGFIKENWKNLFINLFYSL